MGEVSSGNREGPAEEATDEMLGRRGSGLSTWSSCIGADIMAKKSSAVVDGPGVNEERDSCRSSKDSVSFGGSFRGLLLLLGGRAGRMPGVSKEHWGDSGLPGSEEKVTEGDADGDDDVDRSMDALGVTSTSVLTLVASVEWSDTVLLFDP